MLVKFSFKVLFLHIFWHLIAQNFQPTFRFLRLTAELDVANFSGFAFYSWSCYQIFSMKFVLYQTFISSRNCTAAYL